MADEKNTNKDVLVIGAGIVGVCCAVYLQRAGFRVTIIDRGEPGRGTSFGAAGNLGGNPHFAIPGLIWKLPRMLLDPMHPLSIRWRDLPALAAWFRRYLLFAEPARAKAITKASAEIGSRVFDDYESLLGEAGAPDLLTRRGRLFVWTTEDGFQRDQHGLEVRRQHGIALQELTGAEVRELEPAIGPTVKRGVYTPDAGHLLNPLRVVSVLTDIFLKKGGRFLKENVRDVAIDADGCPRVRTDAVTHAPEQLVLAAGIWSKPFAERLGTKVPLVAERGYHAMMPEPGVEMKISTLWEERKIIFTPMEHGIRASGIAEFSASEAPPRYELAERLRRSALDLIPGLNDAHYTRWMGQRPVTPDYLPVIGRSPRHPRVIFAFGHGHSGYHLGPSTGSLVAMIAAERAPNIDVAPFRADRFQS